MVAWLEQPLGGVQPVAPRLSGVARVVATTKALKMLMKARGCTVARKSHHFGEKGRKAGGEAMRIVPAFLAESDDGIPLRTFSSEAEAQCWLN